MREVDVIVYGTINMDLVATLERFPNHGETISSKSYEEIPGGKAANQAVTIQRLEKKVALVGKVGKDAYAERLKHLFHHEGINLDYLYTSETTSTGTAIIIVDQNGQNMIITNQNANKHLSIDEVSSSIETAKLASAALLQLEMAKEVAQYLISALSRLNIPIFVNLAPVVDLDPYVRKLIDFLIINEVEAEQLTGNKVRNVDTAKQAIPELIDQGYSNVIITLGEKGVVIGNNLLVEHIPSPIVESVDTTAAGDCFCGALVTYWLDEKDVLEATKRAVSAAAISVTKKGAQPSLPFKRDVEAFIKTEMKKKELGI
ncbi:ribokinase [Bacillus weihaiensis]|uniref:ribokinase n=1 Tax=Bacillus weihaiensis TaxID=1547283 RepID=UPI002352A9D1|nr:ribokinase [Bacillus weihaiensis]